MTGTLSTPASPPPAPRHRRWWLRVLVAILVLLAIVGLAVAWLFTTPGGARVLLDRARSAFAPEATLGGVEGSLAGTLRVKTIEVTRPGLRVRIDDLEIEREPGNLFAGRVVFRRLHAGRVEVRTASSDATARIPLSFEPPYPVRVNEIRVVELRFGALEAGDASKPDVVIRELTLRGEGDQRSWTVESAEAATPLGNLSLEGTVETKRPFTLGARASLSGSRDGGAYSAKAELAGTLERFDARFSGDHAGLRGEGTLAVAPFERAPLRSLALKVNGVDLAKYTGLPSTRLAIDARLAFDDAGLHGPVSIVNADPGTLDRDRWPVRSAAGRLRIVLGDDGVSRVEATEAVFALAGEGEARGRLAWTPQRFETQLAVTRTDLSRLHADLRPTRLAGTVSATSEGGRQRFDVALSEPRFELAGKAVLEGERLVVDTVNVKREGGTLAGTGEVRLAGRREFRFNGRAEHFDPSSLVKTASGDLNFRFTARGTLTPLAGDVTLDLAPSRWAGLPASGRVKASGDATRIAASDIALAFGDARIEARGALGRAGDAMDIRLRAPDLAAIGRPLGISLAGALDAEATVTGGFAAPAGRFSMRGSKLALPSGLRVEEAQAQGRIGAEVASPVAGTLDAKGVSRSEGGELTRVASRVMARLDGTRGAHRLEVTAAIAKDADLKAAFQGGLETLQRKAVWRGRVETLELTGRSAFALAAPATLTVAADRVELGEAILRGTWGEARFLTTRWTPEAIELRGSSPGLAVRRSARALRMETLPRGDLRVSAEWNLRAAETVDGHIIVQRIDGDLGVGEPPRPLGLSALSARIDIARGRARATASVRGERLGEASAEFQGTLRHVRAGLGIAPDTPLEGRIDARMPTLEWLALWMGPEARATGAAEAHVALSGTTESPRWSGRLSAANVALREPQSGFEVQGGELALRLEGRRVAVERFTATTPWKPSDEAKSAMGGSLPASGTLSADGAIDLAARTGAIRVRADNIPVTQLPKRFVAISGEGELKAGADRLLATGAFRADAGWIGALETPLPSVSEDVVVVRSAQPGDAGRPRERIRLDMRLTLGDRLYFHGRGLQTRLSGNLHVQGTPGAGLRATGSIRTADGTYDAYGRDLQIEHGTLTFYGSLENPALNVLALRKGLPVEAGVQVLGNVARPRVRLVSTPEVPDPEKLSWLVLGRGPEDVSQGEASTLVAAATALLGRNYPGTNIARRFGFDEVRIGRADTASALGALPQSTVAGRTGSASAAEVVSVGKRLSDSVHVIYEQGLADAEGALRIAWKLTRQFELLVRAGYLPGVDAVYRWTFD